MKPLSPLEDPYSNIQACILFEAEAIFFAIVTLECGIVWWRKELTVKSSVLMISFRVCMCVFFIQSLSFSIRSAHNISARFILFITHLYVLCFTYLLNLRLPMRLCAIFIRHLCLS